MIKKKINFYEKIKPISLENYCDLVNDLIKEIKNKFEFGYLSKQIIDNYIFLNYKKDFQDIYIFKKISFRI